MAEEKQNAAIIANQLHTVLDAQGAEKMAQRFRKSGYGDDGYGVSVGASVDGSFATGREGNQGYYVDGGKEVFLGTVKTIRDFFERRAERLGKPIRVVIKIGIGGQHTPFQGIASVFQVIDMEKGVIVGEYELGEHYEKKITAILKELGADWDEVCIIPSSKSGSTDETMLIFGDILYAMLNNIASKKGILWGMFAGTVFDILHEVNFPDGNELPGRELFMGFNIQLVVKELQGRGLKEATYEDVKEIFGVVLGNMFFETTDQPDASRLSAFIRNSGLDKELGIDAPGFGAMFENVGGRWTGDLHMMAFLAYHGLNAEAYWESRYEGIKEIRQGEHVANKLGNKILDKGIEYIALVVPDEYFWFGKAMEQNFNESIWQEGFANLRAIKQSKWDAQKHHYAGKQNRLVINMAGLDMPGTEFNVFNLPVESSETIKSQELAQQIGRLFTTFYGMTHTVGNRLIARAVTEAGYRVAGVDVNDLDNNPATKILQANLYLRQPFVELGKGFLETRLKKLQADEKEHPGALHKALFEIKEKAENGELEAYLGEAYMRELDLPTNVRDAETFAKVIRQASEYAKANDRTFVPFIYLEGDKFIDLRDYLIDLGLEWVLQGTGDQHISYQQVLAQPHKYLPFIISFMPDKIIPGKPGIGFAKGYLRGISPNMGRDYFAEASYRALTNLESENGRREAGGEGLFLRLSDTWKNREMLKSAMEEGAEIFASDKSRMTTIKRKIQKAEEARLKPQLPLEKTKQGSTRSLVSVTKALVVEKCTIKMGDKITPEPLTPDIQHRLYVEEGKVTLFDQEGKRIGEAEEGDIVDVPQGKYEIYGKHDTTLYVMYTPSGQEAMVYTGFEAMRSPVIQAGFAKIREDMQKPSEQIENRPIIVHEPQTMHSNGSFAKSKETLGKESSGTVDIKQYGRDIDDLKGKGFNPSYEHVFLVYADDLQRIKDNPTLAGQLQNVLAHKIIPVKRPAITQESKGVANALEIEIAAVTLGLTSPEELEGQLSGSAIMLQRIMSKLVGEEIDPSLLLALMGGTSYQITQRLQIMLDKLVPLVDEMTRKIRLRRDMLHKSL